MSGGEAQQLLTGKTWSPQMTTVEQIVSDWRSLQARQAQAPDWPYPGQPYSASTSAADERWNFWQQVKSGADPQDYDAAWDQIESEDLNRRNPK